MGWRAGLLVAMVVGWGGVGWGARFEGPGDEGELARRVEALRGEIAPYLRSLPEKMEVRKRVGIGGAWKFEYEAKDPEKDTAVPTAPEWYGQGFDDSKWQGTTVPEWRYRMKGQGESLPEKTADKWLGHSKMTTSGTICWYRTTFGASRPAAGRRLWLCFDGVDWQAEVYLNGELIGGHSVYYEPFRFDITDRVKETNTLAVRVIAGMRYGEPISYWGVFPDIRAEQQRYTPKAEESIRGNRPIGYHAGGGYGIHREVYLEESGGVLVSRILARNDLSDGSARVQVEMDGAGGMRVQVRVQVLAENFEGAGFEKRVECETGKGTSRQVVSVPMPGAKVWSPERPNLYRCRVTVLEKGAIVDAKDVLFGCRSFSVVNRPVRKQENHPGEYTFAPVKAKWLRIACRGSDATDWNSIWEVDCAAMERGKGAVKASGVYQNYSAEKAVDGDSKTRWAMEGRDQWIQFKMKEGVEFERVRIAWFEAEVRHWDFDLLVSDDGTKWRKVEYKGGGEETQPGDQGDLPAGMLVLNGRPVYLRGTNVQGFNVYSYWGQREKLLNALLLLKAGNFNIVRSCQHVEFPEVLEMMDRVGMMSEQDQGGGYRGVLPLGNRREPHIHTGTVLAETCYNNPGVVLLSFGNEHQFDTAPILRAALEVDPQRVFKPISGRFTHTKEPLVLPDEMWGNVIDDGHPYSGWYGNVVAQTWSNLQILKPRRLVTLGEYGAEALDGYETMLTYPEQFRPPAKEADSLWAASQVEKHDVKMRAGLGREAKNLGEYIEASQNYQEALLADKTIGMRLSARAVGGYFQFHFMDVIPAFWPKAIVSHDQRPKKAYYQMAQINQPVVALPQLSGSRPDGMTVWVCNDLGEPMGACTVEWVISAGGRVLKRDSFGVEVPAISAVKGVTVDLREIVGKAAVFDVGLELKDGKGEVISRYRRNVRGGVVSSQ